MYRPRRPKKPPRQDVDAWLLAHPAVAASLVWEDSRGPHAYLSWSAEWKTGLRQAFLLARAGDSIPVADVPPNLYPLQDSDTLATVLAPADAWAYYRASVAWSLAAEIDRELHWSVSGYAAQELAQLFDSREMFRFIRLGTADLYSYEIMGDHGAVIPAPPLYSYRFLNGNNLIGDTRLSTIGRVLSWCRDNLVHFSSTHTDPTGRPQLVLDAEDTWQYRGIPPMVRVLAGTQITSRPSWGIGVRCYTAGCYGTVGLLRALLRVVNIPVKLLRVQGHNQPYFMADGRYLAHGDDPYDPCVIMTPPIPGEDFLIDQATYDAWFGAGLSNVERENNISRRLRELGLQYLPDCLLHAYCSDIANGLGHGEGEVFRELSVNLPLSELERRDLWSRMDAKIAGFGGCGHIP